MYESIVVEINKSTELVIYKSQYQETGIRIKYT